MENNNNQIFYYDKRPKNTLLLYCLFFFIVPSFLAIGLMLFTKDELFINSTVNLLVYILAFIIFIVYLKDYLLDDIDSAKENKINILSSMFIGYFILMFANTFSNSIMEMLKPIFNLEDSSLNQQAIEELINGGYFFPMLITSCICAPVVEELVFRKAIFKITKTPALGIIVSGLAFGLIHVINGGDYIQSIPYIISGVAFGTIYVINKNNIWSCILVHALSNTISLVAILFLF